MTDSDHPVVLIVEDDPDVMEIYELWLRPEYDVQVATNGHEALRQLDSTIDVVLLDRKMPGMSGGEVLTEIRNRGTDCRVAMVTGVDPDFDIIEMGFDEYIKKPPDNEELCATIERLIDRSTLDEDLQEYYSLVSKRATLQAELSDDELKSNDEYAELVERIETHRKAIGETMGDMSSDTGFVGAVREIMGADRYSDTSSSHDNNGRIDSAE